MIKRPKDCELFSIQGHFHNESRTEYESCEIPWWLAEIAWAEYARQGHGSQSCERINQRGGFGRHELLNLIRGQRLGTKVTDEFKGRDVKGSENAED